MKKQKSCSIISKWSGFPFLYKFCSVLEIQMAPVIYGLFICKFSYLQSVKNLPILCIVGLYLTYLRFSYEIGLKTEHKALFFCHSVNPKFLRFHYSVVLMERLPRNTKAACITKIFTLKYNCMKLFKLLNLNTLSFFNILLYFFQFSHPSS